jgi:DNA primase
MDTQQTGEADISEGLETLLSACAPVRGKAAAWLKARRIFQKTWQAQGLRVVEDYRKVGNLLRDRFSYEDLRAWGLVNTEGNLRFYRHTLLVPYFDTEHQPEPRPVYLQAFAIDPAVKPPVLSLSGMTGFTGPIPCPYNAPVLDGTAGRLYLCEDVLDTLGLLEAGFPAVGIQGSVSFRAEWIPRFQNKSVYVAFAADATGKAASDRLLSLFAENGIDAHRLKLPPGKDISEWLRTGGLGIHLE